MLRNVKKMKKILIIGLCIAISLVVAGSAVAASIVVNVDLVTPNVTENGYGVGPVQSTANGNPVNGGLTCLDISKESYFGVPFDASVSTLQPQNMTSARFGADPAAISRYEEAAWLIGQMPSNPTSQAQKTQVADLQYAVWKIFDTNADALLTQYFPGWDQTAVTTLLNQAANINPSNYDFSTVRIYTPTGSYASNQEFMSGSAIYVTSLPPTGNTAPIPASFMLLASGLLALTILGFRKKAMVVQEDKREDK